MADNTELPPAGESRSLAQSINTAILSSHTKINRLILDRMPHAVPPQADNPSTYITGLLHIGAIYIAFESLWQNILHVHTDIAPVPYAYPFRKPGDPSDPDHRHGIQPLLETDRSRHALEMAYWPNMLRAARVKADIRAMTGWSAHEVDEQLRSAGTTGALGTFIAHIEEAISSRPHLLLAYSYSLYLALLSGGSYIRAELMYLRAGFWMAVPDPIRPGMVPCNREPEEPEKLRRHSTSECDSTPHGLAKEDPSITLPLSFFDFDTPIGQENPRQQFKDLKAEFKRRFADASGGLVDSEWQDIIAESVAIFEHLEAVVRQLDEICGGGAEEALQGKTQGRAAKGVSPSSHQPQPRPLGIGSRLRDSIAIAKGRLLRKVRKSSGVGAPNTGTTYPPGLSESSKRLLDSSDGVSKALQEDEREANLARDAVLPGEGFRTIRYDDDQQPDTDFNVGRHGTGGNDGASDDYRGSMGPGSKVCLIFRSPAVPANKNPGTSAATVQIMNGGHDQSLKSTVSIFSVFISVAVGIAACFYVYGTAVPAYFVGKDW
ncbi:hypothetical protein diail_7810 [Diaporthe ilicicola]|nr:hypothetical protein diail_7810 [Diaporthe ilicicola]